MRGNTYDWHHVDVIVGHRVAVVAAAVAGNDGLRTTVVDPRINDDVAQLAFVVALFHDAAVVVVHVVDTVVDYGRQLEVLRRRGFIAFQETSGPRWYKRIA